MGPRRLAAGVYMPMGSGIQKLLLVEEGCREGTEPQNGK